MGKYRRGRKQLLSSGNSLADVPLGEIWFAICSAFWWICATLLRLWQYNPLSVILRRQRHLYPFASREEHCPIKPPWSECLVDFFRSDETRKIKLLQWVQELLPRMGVEDFTTSWNDGLALCSFLEEVCPGLCPYPELLKPHHRVNNCRLGIRLAQRYLALPKMMITAEEMAIADPDLEMKIMHLVQLIKWRYQRGGTTAIQSPASQKARLALSKDPVCAKVVARGTGLKAGIVGRRAKFNILTDSAAYLDVHITIMGPNNEMNSERVTSLTQGLDRRDIRMRSSPGYPTSSEDDVKSKFIKDNVGNVFLRQKSVEEDQYQNIIPFDYQCVGEGRFLVTYIPRSFGTHFISIKSQEVDIEGSPFEVKVSDWMTSWNVVPKPKVMSFDMLPSIEEASNSGKDARNTANRSNMSHVSKQLNVMKKRVLKRVITRNGEEIILTPSPTLSRQSSADISDFSEEDQNGPKEDKTKRPNGSPSRASSSSEAVGVLQDIASAASGNGSDDFSSNNCNITLSVTSFEDERDEIKILGESSVTSKASPFTQWSTKETSPPTYDRTLGMYLSSPRILEKIPESPLHISVKSQILHPSSPPPSVVHTVTNCQRSESGGNTGIDSHLNVTSLCQSPSISDDASDHCSDATDAGNSPSHLEFPNLSKELTNSSDFTPTGRSASASFTNRQRFEESLNHLDEDADDRVDTCSQLVSALTELRPGAVRKKIGRSYSDGAKGGVEARLDRHNNIRMRRMTADAGDSSWSSDSSDQEIASQPYTTSGNSTRTKLLQSDSLRKMCVYMQEDAVTLNPSLNPLASPDLGSTSVQLSHPHRAMSSNGKAGSLWPSEKGRRNQKLAATRKWKTFDGGTTVEHEGTWGKNARWKLSLQGKSHSFSASSWRRHDGSGRDPRLCYAYSESSEMENMSILDKLNDDDDEILEVVIESTEPQDHSTEVNEDAQEDEALGKDHTVEDTDIRSFSESSLSSSPSKSQSRMSLSRQNCVGDSKSSSGISVDTDRSRPTSEDTNMDAAEEVKTRRFRTIHTQSRKPKEAATISVLVPKAKTDKSTQVSYSEIKTETGWKPAAIRRQRRKKYLKITVSNSSPNFGKSSPTEYSSESVNPPPISTLLTSETAPTQDYTYTDEKSPFSGNEVGAQREFNSKHGKQSTKINNLKCIPAKTCFESGTEKKETVVKRFMTEKGESRGCVKKTSTSEQSDSEPADNNRRHSEITIGFSPLSSCSRTRSEPQLFRNSYLPVEGKEIWGGYRERFFKSHVSDHVMDWVQRSAVGEDHEQPQRQSTVDTLDSGIENESPGNSGFISGHRRLHRRPYPWSIDLDPGVMPPDVAAGRGCGDLVSRHRPLVKKSYPWAVNKGLMPGNLNSLSAFGREDLEHLRLSWDVIEAAVHRTVCEILSKSPPTSSACSDNEMRSLSDSELCCSSQHGFQRRRKTKMSRGGCVVSKSSISLGGDLYRSVFLLPSQTPSSSSLQALSPGLGETKSDGRYSPYSATDIPCFELPLDAIKIKQKSAGFTGKVHKFPHLKDQLQQHQIKSVENVRQKNLARHSEARPQQSAHLSASSSSPKPLVEGVPDSSETSTATAEGARAVYRKQLTRSARHLESDDLASNELSNISADSQHVSSKRIDNAEVSNPLIVIHDPSQQNQNARISSTSTDDSYCGFGISRTRRYDLIDHLKDFRDLTERRKSTEFLTGTLQGRNLSPGSLHELCLTESSLDGLSQISDPFDENSPFTRDSYGAGKCFFQDLDLDALEGICFGANVDGGEKGQTVGKHANGRTNPLSYSSRADQSYSSRTDQRLSSVSSFGQELPPSPLRANITRSFLKGISLPVNNAMSVASGKYIAYGAGLSVGQVDASNNFQVWAERPGNGCVSVAIFGPRCHCVKETSVTYIGDSIYDVSFSVTSPGYYVIVVKWGEENLPDSPFICQVTY